MVKRVITDGRLTAAGVVAGQAALAGMEMELKAKDLPHGLVKCTYLGRVREDEPLRCLTRVKFEWKFLGELFQGTVQHTSFAAKALHAGGRKTGLAPPWAAKLPLRVVCLSTTVAQRRPLSAMSAHDEVKCHGMGLPEAGAGRPTADTTIATRDGKRQEFLKCAHVAGRMWLCHPGGVLGTSGLQQLEISGEPEAKKPRGRLSRLPRIYPGEALDKLMAMAHFKAEVLRAQLEQREPDMAEAVAKFNVDATTWSKAPKNVVIIWSYKTLEGAWQLEATEVAFKSLR